jgi:hypothetical protein
MIPSSVPLSKRNLLERTIERVTGNPRIRGNKRETGGPTRHTHHNIVKFAILTLLDKRDYSRDEHTF